jgi:hypothetical protein
MAAPARRVRNLTDDEPDNDEPTQPDIPPFVAPDAKGDLRVTKLPKREPRMPKGIYDRSKPRAPKDDAANDAAKPATKARKPRALAVVAKVAKAIVAPAGARFDVSVDLRGGAVTINAQAGSLTLAPDEVLALFAFLGRR